MEHNSTHQLNVIDEIERIEAILFFLEDFFDLFLNIKGYSISKKTPAGISIIFELVYDRLEMIKKTHRDTIDNSHTYPSWE
jgi:hypothetical protein